MANASNDSVADHYSALGVSSTADSNEIKRAYRALLLQLHPDKDINKESLDDNKDIGVQLVIEAYRVLSDEGSRQNYDQERNRQRALRAPPLATPTIALTVDLDDCEAVFDPHGGLDDSPIYYSYPCRCSDSFRFMVQDLENGIDVVQCNGCTERCRIEYQEVDPID